jgi:acyl-coenzyme A synthetase/AMP-(fatty) acid ligase
LDLFGAAVAGATLYLVPKSVSLLAGEVKKFIESNEISVWYSVPSILTMLVEMGGLEKGDLPSLRVLLFAGEVFPTKYLSRLMTLLPHAQFANLYGPTETNVCTAYTVQAVPPEDSDPVSIGKAITNVETFVLDSSDGLVAPGTVGELVVRGPTVMSGYWGDAHLTAAKLIPSPLPRHLGDMVYRTGDLVVEQDNGTYKFIGRRDNQIKSRGYRIELGDVESALSSHPQVLEAVAIAVPDEKISNRIIAFASTIENVGESDLKRYCNDRLPRYMVPERIDVREQLPKTSTGKIDRKALGASAEPAPDGR